MSPRYSKRAIALDPFEVSDDTLAALRSELAAQSEDDDLTADDIEIVNTVVLDSNGGDDGGLNSHAVVHTQPNTDSDTDD